MCVTVQEFRSAEIISQKILIGKSAMHKEAINLERLRESIKQCCGTQNPIYVTLDNTIWQLLLYSRTGLYNVQLHGKVPKQILYFSVEFQACIAYKFLLFGDKFELNINSEFFESFVCINLLKLQSFTFKECGWKVFSSLALLHRWPGGF